MSVAAAKKRRTFALRIVSGVVVAFMVLSSVASANAPTSISATSGHTCASMSDGSVDCWGKSYIPSTLSNVPVRVPGLAGVSSISASIRYNCVLAAGAVECWGDDGFGQLGNGATVDSGVPVSVNTAAPVREVSAGAFHACALLVTGWVQCWGRNLHGALGNGSRTNSSVPVRAQRVSHAVSVSAGYGEDDTCAALSSGAVDCWGANRQGQLGNGTLAATASPVAVKGITTAVSVASGGQHACAVLRSGQVKCWGDNRLGQLGDGAKRSSTTPVTVKGLSHVSAVAVTSGYSCALRLGAIYCWGGNPKDQLGNGLQPQGRTVPVRALNISHAVSISTGKGHACSVLSSGGAVCWGYDDYGQLGNGKGPPSIRSPGPVLFPAGP
jgi:alpha-tubulin suppressor-like RCC1 family protein